MKWSKFIQDDNKFLKDDSPALRLNTSRSHISNSGREFALKSIQKAKADSTVNLNKNLSTSSINDNDLKLKTLVSKYSYRPPKKQFCQEYDSSPNFIVDSRFKNGDATDLDQIMERFSRELTDFIKNFLEKIDAIKSVKQFREEIARRILNSTQDIVTRHIEQLPKFDVSNSPIRKSFSCVQNNLAGIKDASDKKKARVLMFKNEKVQEKNNFNRIESTFNQMNRILQNQKQPKFVRTAKMKRGDRSGDSSVEDVMEKSLYDSRKSYKSRIKSKDALYNINKILNQ